MILALGEGILRAIYARDDLLFRFERADPRITGSKPAPFSEPGSGTETDGGRPWTHTTNGQGLRERYELPCGASPPGADRVVVAVGDSWVFGYGLDEGETIPELLEERLSTADRRVEVVNAGIVGGGAFHARLSFAQLRACLPRIDGVLIGIPHNAAAQVAVSDQARLAADQADVVGGPAFPSWYGYLGLRRLLYRVRAPDYPTGVDLDDPRSGPRALEDIAAIARSARELGASAWIVDWPTHLDASADLELEIGSLAAAAGAASGAPVIGYAMPERACWGVADLGHPGVAGARAIAALVAPAIDAALTGHRWVALPARATEPGCAP